MPAYGQPGITIAGDMVRSFDDFRSSWRVEPAKSLLPTSGTDDFAVSSFGPDALRGAYRKSTGMAELLFFPDTLETLRVAGTETQQVAKGDMAAD